MSVAVGKPPLCVQTSHEQFIIGSLHVTTSVRVDVGVLDMH